MIRVGKAVAISERGKRSNNEDNFGFSEHSHFVLCDGVGGAAKGEIASDIVVKQFVHALQQNPKANLESVLQMAEGKLSACVENHPESSGMATTLTFSQIKENGILVAWCGDSRIYQFRNGKVIFQTEDHSWVNEAIRSGIITEDEATNHPKSNIITRAIMGREKPAQLESREIRDVEKGDYFLHCSDGVLEAWSNPDMEALFGQGFDLERIISLLADECRQLSKDNFTALVYQIELAEVPEPLEPAEALFLNKRKTDPNGAKRFAPKYLLLSFGIILAGVVIAFWVINPQKNQPFEVKPTRQIVANSDSKKDMTGNPVLQKSESNANKIDPTTLIDSTDHSDTLVPKISKKLRNQSPKYANPKLPHP